jgi:hypothetical protein
MGNRLPAAAYDKLMDAAHMIQDAAFQAGADCGREGALPEVLNLIDAVLADGEGFNNLVHRIEELLEADRER